jgi:ribosomal protein S14
MKQPVLIPYRCRTCSSPEAELSALGSRLRCVACGRDHGLLNDVRAALRDEARLQAAQKALQVYPVGRRVARAPGRTTG